METTETPRSNQKALSHIPELDGVRGIAILSVLFYHLFWFTSPGGGWAGIPHAIWKIAQVGWTGVNIFFVLSGFLITRILINQRGENNYFKKFYFRRALRILPLYFLTLLFIYFHYEKSSSFVVLNLFFLAHVPGLFGIVPCYPGLWSLSMEEQFYLVWPQFVKRISIPNLKKAALLLCLISPLLRAFTFLSPSFSIVSLILGGFDGFAYGAIIAIFNSDKDQRDRVLKKYEFICFVFSLILLLVGGNFGITTRQRLIGEMFLPSVIYLLTSVLMIHSIRRSGARYLKVLSRGILPHWGKLSYAAYLCHYPVPEIVNKIFSWYPQIYSYYFSFGFACLQFGLAMLGTYLIASILHRWVETPFLNLKHREFRFSNHESKVLFSDT